MKYIIAFIVLISLVFCGHPLEKFKPADQINEEVKKALLECIQQSDASLILKLYAAETLNNPYNTLTHLSTFAVNGADEKVISYCRNKAFNSAS